MKFKTKLVSILALFAVVFSFMIVGVLAVKTTNFNVGGNINFRATGINAVISQGTLNNALWVDESEAENKLKEIILNTYKTGEEIEEEFLSWQDLNLMFNEKGEDATITFTITNTSEHEEYFSVNASVNQGSSTNATVNISPKMVELAPGDTQDYTLIFSITDPSMDASISGFEIDLDMQIITVFTASEYPTLIFAYDDTNFTASVKGNSGNKPTGEIEIPSMIKKNNLVYKVTSIKGNLTATHKGSFYACSGMTSIKLPYGLKSIEEWAFSACTGLTHIELPASLMNMGLYAFNDCNGLTSVNYLGDINSWVSIKFSSFNSNPTYYSKELKINGEVIQDVVIDKATSINQYAFYNCNNITSLTLGNQVTSIGNSAFYNCSGLTGELVIPSVVTSIGGGAFSGCSGFTGELILPNSLTSIGGGAFSGCSGFTSVNIPSIVTSIGSGAFRNCSGLTGNIELPVGITSIESDTFDGCKKISSVEIPAGATKIGQYAFRNCNNLKDVIYLGDVNSWSTISFGLVANPILNSGSLKIKGQVLTDAIIDNATSISSYAFNNCKTLINLTLGEQVTSIGVNAFQNCSGLKNVEIASSVTSIGANAFQNCSSLTSIKLPESVTTIASRAFYGCSKLTIIIIDSATIAGTISGTGTSVCGGLIAKATAIYVKTDIVGSLNSYVTTNYTVVTEITEGEYAGYTKYSKT